MIADEELDAREAVAKGPRAISRAAFYAMWYGLWLPLFGLLSWAAVSQVGEKSSRPSMAILGIYSLSSVAIIGLSYASIDFMLRRLGLSRSGRTVEQRGRRAAASGMASDGEWIEVGLPGPWGRGAIVGARVSLLLIGLVVLVNLLILPSWAWVDLVEGLTIPVLFGLLALAVLRLFKLLPTRADAVGITGPGARPPLPIMRRCFVPWSRVAACQIVTDRDPSGRAATAFAILWDARGARLLRLNLTLFSEVDHDRLIKFLRRKLPKMMIDPWDDPA